MGFLNRAGGLQKGKPTLPFPWLGSRQGLSIIQPVTYLLGKMWFSYAVVLCFIFLSCCFDKGSWDIDIFLCRGGALHVFGVLKETSNLDSELGWRIYSSAILQHLQCVSNGDYTSPVHLGVVDRYLRRMRDETITDKARPSFISHK